MARTVLNGRKRTRTAEEREEHERQRREARELEEKKQEERIKKRKMKKALEGGLATLLPVPACSPHATPPRMFPIPNARRGDREADRKEWSARAWNPPALSSVGQRADRPFDAPMQLEWWG